MAVFGSSKVISKNNHINPISTGLSYLVVALREGGGSTPSIKFDPDILEH